MARITTSQLKTIVATEEENLDSFVATAELIVKEKLEGKGMSEERLVQITLYLAAHFLSLSDRQPDSEKIGDVSTKYNGVTAMGLRSSLHGQAAITLDDSKTLITLDSDTPVLMVL